jgi:hypothetical protein
MSFGKVLSVLGKIGNVAGIIVEGVGWLSSLFGKKKLPPPPKLPQFDEDHDGDTEPVPLTWRDVEKQRNDAARSVAAAKAGKPPSSRYD